MYGPGYTLNNLFAGSQQAIVTTYKSLFRLVCAAAALKRYEVWELDFSGNSTPLASDCNIQFDLMWCSSTTAGTSTAATPMGTDSNGGVATDVSVVVGAVNFSAEPTTFSATPAFLRSVNQRSPAFWQASPSGGLKAPATNNAGLCGRALSPVYTGNALGVVRLSDI